eukprot:snap_masked-scaffold_19-processed-gene-5.32-mRNA-1 protein AED:1.00 eAED:1.00 QI:0/-1/0/0/-1/1/1/0/481
MKPTQTLREDQVSASKVFVPYSRDLEHDEISTNHIPSITSRAMAENIGNTGFDSQSVGSFAPYGSAPKRKSNIFDISDTDLPLPRTGSLPAYSKMYSLHQKKTKFRKHIIVFLLFLLLCLAAATTSYLLLESTGSGKEESSDDGEADINVVPAELLEACQGIEAEGNSLRLSEAISLSEAGDTLTISNVNLTCLPKDSLLPYLGYSPNLTTLIFVSSTITVIDTDVFDLGVGASTTTLQFDNCNIEYIRDQTQKMSAISFINARVGTFPNKFPMSGLRLSGTSNIQFNNNFVFFLTEKTNQFSLIFFENFFDDEKIIQFRNVLREFDRKIHFSNTLLSIQGFVFSSNSFSSLPEGLFNPENIDFGNDAITIAFGLSEEFESVEEGAVQRQNGKKYLLSFSGCSKFSTEALETIVNELDVQALILEGTAITDLSGIDFTTFSDFQLLNVENTEVAPLCSEEDAFRESLALPTEVDINGCLEE